MRILSLSLDQKILHPHSSVFQRMQWYATLFHEIHIICFTLNKQNAKPFQKGNLFLYPTNSKSKIHYFLDAYQLGKKIIQERNLERIDSVITTQDPFETAIIGFLLKKKFGLSLNIQDHGNFFESRFFRKESLPNCLRYHLGKILLKKSDSIRTVSLREKKYIESYFSYSPDRIVNIPIFTNWKKNAVLEPKFNVKQKYPGFDFYILTLCRLEKVKNIPLLIRAFSEVHKKFPHTLLLIVGNGSQKRYLEKIIKKENLQKNIIMEEWTEDAISYYKTVDLFVLSSFSEGWGLTVIEAASSLCPIIMTDTGCAREFIQDNVNGWVIKINNTEDMTYALNEAIGDKKKRISFAQQAFKNLSLLPNEKTTLQQLQQVWIKALPTTEL